MGSAFDTAFETAATDLDSSSGADTYSSSTPATDTDPRSDTASAPDTGSEAGTDEDSGATVITLSFVEKIEMPPNYQLHEVLVGPGGSNDPYEGSWAVVSDSSAMNNENAYDRWADAVPIDLSAFAGQTIRLGFHYEGAMEAMEAWNIDDICIESSDSQGCLWSEAFNEEPGLGEDLPQGWLQILGPEDYPSSFDWSVSFDAPYSEPACVQIPFEIHQQDAVLVSPSISLE